MSMESKTYKKIPTEGNLRVFWIELKGNRDEFRVLTKNFNESEIYFDGKLAYPPGAMALPPYTIFFSIISATASLATIAKILYNYLKNKKKENEKKICFKFNGKEMTIEGSYSEKEILGIVQEFSKIAAVEEIKAISKKRKKEFKSELNELQTLLQTYTKLVEIGEDKKSSSKELTSKLKAYQNKKSEIETRISYIIEILKD